MNADRQPAPDVRHPANAALRTRIERFARARAAHRALPVCAGSLEAAESRETRADALRRELGRLTAIQTSPDALAQALERAAASLDAALASMESDLFDRVDRLDFPSLRAHLPRAVESHRREGISLLDLLLTDRAQLPARIGKIEYLVTLLSTEECDGRRQIVHDPASLTPNLVRIAVETASLPDASEIAVEIHQAASLDFDSTNPMRGLARIRARKEGLGLGRFSPEILRAVVTYNARMFNWIASMRDGSRASDAEIGEVLNGLYPGEPAGAAAARDQDSDAVIEADTDPPARTEFDFDANVLVSGELDQIVAAFRRRLQGDRIGSCGPERIALALDDSRVDALEREALLAAAPSKLQSVVARVVVVGLMLRDRGAIAPELLDLGITHAELSTQWVVELERSLGRLVSQLVAEGGEYALAGALSGIKTKYLLAARSAARLEGAVPPISGASSGSSNRIPDGARMAREAANGLSGVAARAGRAPASARSANEGAGSAAPAGRGRLRAAVALALVVAVAAALFLVTRHPAGTASILRSSELARISPYVASAYRSEGGRGGLLIGRVDASFERLDVTARAEAVARMTDQLRRGGIREAMLYDERGALRVHVANGIVRRPRSENAPPAKAPSPAVAAL